MSQNNENNKRTTTKIDRSIKLEYIHKRSTIENINIENKIEELSRWRTQKVLKKEEAIHIL